MSVISKLPPLKIGDLYVRVPIIQGGMGVGISLSNLASAVANEGGIGVIATAGIGMLEPDFNQNFREANKRALKSEIRKARQKTTGVIGVNIMMALSDFDELAIAAVEEGVDVIFLGGGSASQKSRSPSSAGKFEKSRYQSGADCFLRPRRRNHISVLG